MTGPGDSWDEDDTQGAGFAMAQGDIAVNLFVVLLVVLASLSIARLSHSPDGYVSPVARNAAPDQGAPPPLGWKKVLPTYPKVVVFGGRVHHLDLTALARAFAGDRRLDLGPGARDASRMIRRDLDPSAHKVILWFNQGRIPAPLIHDAVPLSRIAGPEGAAFLKRLGDAPKLDLIVYPDQMARAVPLIDALFDRPTDLRLIVPDRDRALTLVSSGRDFGFERSFK